MEDLTIRLKIEQPVELRSCPAGLALFNVRVIWVDKFDSAAGSRDAVVVATGQRFTGGAKNNTDRGSLRVRPLTLTEGVLSFVR